MPVLSISSAVSYGYVGNAAIQPLLNAAGWEIWRVDTVLFSNHPGHGGFTGVIRPAAEVADQLAGLRALEGFRRLTAVMTGYLGDPGNGEAAAETVAAAKETNPNALYLLDPVLGDDGKLYVREGVEEAIAEHLLPLADIVTPNLFELGRLTDKPVDTLDNALSAAEELLIRGPGLVVVTGVPLGDGAVGLLAVTDDTALLATAPQHPVKVFGAGDSFAALLMSEILAGLPVQDALSQAGGAITAITRSAGRLDAHEVDLIGALHDVAEADPLPIRDLWAG